MFDFIYIIFVFRSLGYSLSGDEQDAHELFQGLLDAIESDNESYKVDNNPRSLYDAVENVDGSSNLSGIVSKHGKPVLKVRPMVRMMKMSLDQTKYVFTALQLLFSFFIVSPRRNFSFCRNYNKQSEKTRKCFAYQIDAFQ